VFHFLLCSVSPGLIAPLPSGFAHADSLLLEDNEAALPFHYNLFLRSHTQYSVNYECSFVVEEDSKVVSTAPNCSECGRKRASVYCRT
jgi:hypothetical protein